MDNLLPNTLWSKQKYGPGTNGSLVKYLLGIEERKENNDKEGQLRDNNIHVPNLQKLYYKILLRLGLNRKTILGWMHLPTSFGGIGLRILFPEILTTRINVFL